MNHWSSLRRGAIALAAASLLTAALAAPARAESVGGRGWSGTWAASPHEATDAFGPSWSTTGFDDQSVRQVVRVSAGGPTVRIRLSNAYGTSPLHLTSATIAKAGAGAAIVPGTVKKLTFKGRHSAVVRKGGELASDPAWLRVEALDRLTVTLYFKRQTGPATHHAFAGTTSYRAPGDHTRDAAGTAFSETSPSWFYLVGVDVRGLLPQRHAVVAFGDSITDGVASTPEANNRYPDELAERLVAAGKPRGVLNAGIGGNRVLNDSTCFGEAAVDRFFRDAIDEPNVRTVIVLEGINDIHAPDAGGFPCFDPAVAVTADQLIAGHRELIRQAHKRGVKAIGATVMPYEDSFFFTARGETVRDALNEWIRTSGEYDAVVDLDLAMRDPADPDRMLAAYDSGDHLHPNDAGMAAMAAAVDLSEL
jgi:lysophospholipase L1-like esterase